MKKVIYWFRGDLRIHDNPALYNAAKESQILPIYILDDTNSGEYQMGNASKVWLHHSLASLNKTLEENLIFKKGDPLKIIIKLARDNKIDSIYWNRCYEPWQINRDQNIKKILEQSGIKVISYNASLLWEPWNILKDDGTPYKVFTPFYRKSCLSTFTPRSPLPIPEKISYITDKNSTDINDLKLIPKIAWDKKFEKYWSIGEEAAYNKLDSFLESGIEGYKEGRNFPSKNNVSRLSPHLHFGEISSNYIWYKIKSQESRRCIQDIDHFCSELGWREFSYYLLYHFPYLPKQNLNSKFNVFPWKEDKKMLELWQKGKTGIPIIDAGMRELWETGYMHNRVRMIVGSFLVKNLLLHWKYGERWFWNCLVDADLANNSASWQWIAGCGADAAPYFRIFNPVTQGQKFDSTGSYTRKFVPEIAKLPDKYLFSPWEAPDNILNAAEVVLGKDYPNPIVDLQMSRNRALDAFASIKNEDSKVILRSNSI
jgi:deoxyribodipyrimidine photo-lyase